MRQAFAARRQAVLLLARHLAEGAVVAIRQEHRIVAEALVAARRPHQRAVDPRLELLDMAIRPGDAQGGDEMRARGSVLPLARSLSSIVCIAPAKSLDGPAQRAE